MNKNNGGGLGTLGVLQIIFIVLKILNLISWPWLVVFIPTYIGFIIFVLCVLILTLLD